MIRELCRYPCPDERPAYTLFQELKITRRMNSKYQIHGKFQWSQGWKWIPPSSLHQRLADRLDSFWSFRVSVLVMGCMTFGIIQGKLYRHHLFFFRINYCLVYEIPASGDSFPPITFLACPESYHDQPEFFIA